jgi:short-subunit dehydrogenase
LLLFSEPINDIGFQISKLMKNSFKDKIIIITGASSGIGEALVHEFAKQGSKIVLAARNELKILQIEKELNEKGMTVIAITTDVSRESDCKHLIETTIDRFGSVDILINNAGISMKALFHEADLQVLRRLMDVNFWGTVYCTRYALPYLVRSKGSLVAVSSIAGFNGLPGRSGYSASKFAIHGLMETIRIENLKNGLHVMVVAPGFTASEIRKHALLADGTEQGESPRDENHLMSPQFVARSIIKGIKRKRRNKILTWEGKLTALFQRIIPRVVDQAYYNELAKEPNSPFK